MSTGTRGGAPVRNTALRRLAAPVAVLTVCHKERLHGTTVSSVSRISADPQLIGVCLRAGSVLRGLASGAGRFVVNVLDGGQGPLARWFADSDRPEGAAQFAGLPWRPDPYAKAPLLDGALAHYACRTSGIVAVGDHDVLIGRVVRAEGGEGDPLLSYNGGLRTGALQPIPPAGPNDQPLMTRKAAL